MKRKNATRNALFTSLLSLLLCVSMLVGTTFAWFTDSVESGMNQIVAGNLDVELEYSEDLSSWTPVQDAKTLFSGNLWEPGHTEVVYLKLSNLGTLALKYQFSVNFQDTVIGTSVEGNEIKLSEHLMYNIVPADKVFADRDAAREAAEKGAQKLANYTEKGQMKAGDPAKTVALVIYMPETVGNEANYRGQAIPQIDLGINLVATQLENEDDTFGDDYDAGAWVETMSVSNAAELATALNAAVGERVLVSLANDIDLSNEAWTPIGDKDKDLYFTGALEGNGKKISGLDVADGDYVALISAAKDAVIRNLTVEGAVSGDNAAGIVARVEGNTLIENCTSNVAVSGTTKAGGIACNVTGADAKIINCVNNADVSCSRAAAGGVGGIVGYVNGDASVEIINCTNNGNVTGTEDQTTGAVIGNAGGASKGMIAGFKNTGVISGKNYVGDGLNRWLEDENGLVLAGYCATPTNWVVADAIGTADELVAAFANLKAGDVLSITADIDMTGKTITPVTGNKAFTMLGNGYTISNLNSTAQALFVDHSGSSAYTFDSVNLENCSVASTTNYGALFVGDGDTSDAITITNCHVTNCTVSSAKYAAAFVGYTAGWNVQNDGPVYSDVTIRDCSVTGGSITGGGSTAAAIGHAGGNVDTTSIVENLKVENVAINGEDTAHTGVAVGTANVGKTIINNVTYSNVTGNHNGLYGRFVPGTTGTLTIDGSNVTPVASATDLEAAINAGATNLSLSAGDYKMPSSGTTSTITITGTKSTVLDMTMGAYMENATVTIEGVTIKTSTGYANGNGSDYAALYTPNVTYKNCTFVGPMRVGRDGAQFIDCTFTALGNDYVWTYGNDVTFEGCTFNTDGKAILIYSDGGSEVSKVSVKNCVFNATAGAKAGAIANQNCAAIEIHNYGNGVNLTTSGNTFDSNFSGEWRIKTYETGKPQVIVNGTEYTTIAIDGKLMTIDASKNVTVL